MSERMLLASEAELFGWEVLRAANRTQASE